MRFIKVRARFLTGVSFIACTCAQSRIDHSHAKVCEDPECTHALRG